MKTISFMLLLVCGLVVAAQEDIQPTYSTRLAI